jgi:hypothetical protein
MSTDADSSPSDSSDEDMGVAIDANGSGSVSVSQSGNDSESESKDDQGLEAEATSTTVVVDKLKRDLLATAAAYDRGYGATRGVRDKVDALIEDLSRYQAIDDVATGFALDLDSSGEYFVDNSSTALPPPPSPLKGCWQMVWTTAYDVLSLATPITTVSAIYQDIDPSTNSAINIIDLIPRSQAFLPPQFPTPVTRLQVQTKATRRGPKRVGLLFESVEVQPLKNIFKDSFLPFPLKVDLPTKYLEDFFKGEESPGYFDVSYVDEDMLIIQQNAPGGCFVLVQVDSTDILS